jgi:hypothetical protein
MLSHSGRLIGYRIDDHPVSVILDCLAADLGEDEILLRSTGVHRPDLHAGIGRTLLRARRSP